MSLVDTAKWLRVEFIRRSGERKGSDEDAGVLASNPALHLLQLGLLFKSQEVFYPVDEGAGIGDPSSFPLS